MRYLIFLLLSTLAHAAESDPKIFFNPPTPHAPPIKIGKMTVTVFQVSEGNPKVFFEKTDIPFGDCKTCKRGVSLNGKEFQYGFGMRLEGPDRKHLRVEVKNGSGMKLTTKPEVTIDSGTAYDFSENDLLLSLANAAGEHYRIKLSLSEK